LCKTVWEGVIRPAGRGIRVRRFPDEGGLQRRFTRGDEIGRFNMGSTVILLYGPDQVQWNSDLSAAQSVRIGQTLGDYSSGS
jgi:phosphatidylserine decarboxylase